MSWIQIVVFNVGRKIYHWLFVPFGIKAPSFLVQFFGNSYGQDGELKYWMDLYRKNNQSFPNTHYQRLICGCGNVGKDFFNGKVILDIGSGPAGSLIAFQNARARIGVDPLAEKYGVFQIASQDMIYISCCAEQVPLPSGSIDVVISVNSLDHVKSPQKVVSEARRLLKNGGYFLTSINLYEDPNPREPHFFTPEKISSLFENGYKLEWSKIGPHPVAVPASFEGLDSERFEIDDPLFGYKFMFANCESVIPSDKSKSHMLWARFRKIN